MDEYVDQNLAGQAPDHARTCSQWLDKELANQQTKVEESERGARGVSRQAERDVARRQAEHRAVAAEPAERRRHQARRWKRVQKESLYSQIKALMPAVSADAVPVDSIPLVAQNAQIQRSRASCIELQQQKVQLARALRREASGAAERRRAARRTAQRQLSLEVDQRAADRQERVRHGGARRADARRRTSTRRRPTSRT